MNRNKTLLIFAFAGFTAATACGSSRGVVADQQPPVEALIYSTMPSHWDHRPELAMDGDVATTFQTDGGMDDGDTFLVLLSRAIQVQKIRVVTGDSDGNDRLADASVDTSSDSLKFSQAAQFGNDGVANASLKNRWVSAIRIRMNRRKSTPKLVIQEISIDSRTPVSHVQYGPGRGFFDISCSPDLLGWATRAEKQMEAFWPDTAAMLYSNGLVTPNMVNVIYRTGPRVTGVAATGGGVMEVNTKWCHEHSDDTGLTVHEMAHVVQSIHTSAPGWLVEGTADYIRWVKFEPEHFHPRINVNRATYHDAYQTSATFLGWCVNHYDSQLVTKLNDAARSGRYKNDLLKQYCGKDVDTLWAEFIAAYKADPTHILQPVTQPGMAPREMPIAVAGTSVPVDLTGQFDVTGIVTDGTKVRPDGGFDGEGSTYPAAQIGREVTAKNVRFSIGSPNAANAVACRGKSIQLSGMHHSIWLLASAIEGSHEDQDVVVTYADGTAVNFKQNFSDWYVPEGFPGEFRAVRSAYRNAADGTRDDRTFYVYGYGFKLDPSKGVKSITLPNDEQIRLLGITLAD